MFSTYFISFWKGCKITTKNIGQVVTVNGVEHTGLACSKSSLSVVTSVLHGKLVYQTFAFFIFVCIFFFPFLKFVYLFIFRERGKEGERKRNINVWLPLVCPLLGTWPATQACALTGNGTINPLVHKPAHNPLSHTSQDIFFPFQCPCPYPFLFSSRWHISLIYPILLVLLRSLWGSHVYETCFSLVNQSCVNLTI